MTGKELCETLKTARKNLGINQTDAGNRAGLTQQYVYQIERGVHSPNLDTFCKLAEALGFEVALIDKKNGTDK